MTLKIDTKPLMAALEAIQDLPDLESQLAALERFIVSTELNPHPAPFHHLRRSLEVLGELSFEGKDWQIVSHDLEHFF